MEKTARLLAVLLISAAIVCLGSLTVGATATHPSGPESANQTFAEAESEASVKCLPFGLHGEITAEALVASLCEGSEKLIFVGTTNGLYVMGLDGKLRHFLYSPFGIGYVALIDDISGDGSREVVVALNDTQVPALRCYDGLTWEKLWQFAPIAKVWDDTWVKRQMGISGLQVMEDGDSQSVVIISGRSVFSVDAKEGTERWRFSALHIPKSITVVADLNGDGAGEVFLATEDGHLFLLNGNTGDKRWQTRLPEITALGETIQSTAEHLLTVDGEGGRVAVASSDGMVRVFDLDAKRLGWEVTLPTQVGVAPGPMAPVPNPATEGQPGILVSYGTPTPSASGLGTEVKNRVALLDAAGNTMWDRDIDAWYLHTGSYGGQQVVIVPTEEEIKLLELADGESVVKAIPVSTTDEWGPDVRQIGEDAFLLVDILTAVSSSGEVLWHYPKIGNVKAASGYLVGDPTEDTLFSAEWKSTTNDGYISPVKNDGVTLVTSAYQYSPEIPEAEVRLLNVMDGATGEIAWSYEVSLYDLKNYGGLHEIQVAVDLVGNDGVQDIIGYRDDTVFIFSGKDGISSSFFVGQPVESLDVIHDKASRNAIAVSTASGLTIFDSAGIELWTATGAEWVDGNTIKFMVLDDLNSDSVSDLAALSPAKIVVLRSTDNTTGYDLHLALNPEPDSLIEYVEAVPDANGDGVRDLAYIQRNPGSQKHDNYTPPGCPLLLVKSPVDAKELHRSALHASYPAVDLACGDFDGDGCADSLVCQDSYDACGDTSPGSGNYSPNPSKELRIVSGKSGETVWKHALEPGYSTSGGWNTRPPAQPVGDLNGDGRDDLAWTFDHGGQKYSGYYCQQQLVEIYDVARDTSLKEIQVNPLLSAEAYQHRVSGGESTLAAHVGSDGHVLLIVQSVEPWLPNYDPDATGQRMSRAYLAVLDVETGRTLAAFLGLDATGASIFETHQSDVLGVASAGGAYFLKLDSALKITSPDDGSKTGPSVSIRWEGTTADDFTQVFVDGVRYDAGYASNENLRLGRGQHEIVVTSIDEYGRVSYGPPDIGPPLTITVTPSPWKPVLLVLSLFILLAMIVLLFYARLHRILRARRRAAK